MERLKVYNEKRKCGAYTLQSFECCISECTSYYKNRIFGVGAGITVQQLSHCLGSCNTGVPKSESHAFPSSFLLTYTRIEFLALSLAQL